MSNKEKYKILCETEGSAIPLFLQYWWMEAVCHGKHWDVALAYDRDIIVGALPYLVGNKLGVRYVLQPQLTQFNGPWYRLNPSFSHNQRLEFEKHVASLLIDQLEAQRFSFFLQHFSPEVSNWLPFHWRGFSQTTRYTYRLEDISDPELVFAQFDKGRRQKPIRRVLDHLSVVDDLTPEQFAQFHYDYWRSRGQKDELSQDFIARIVRVALERNQGLLLGLRDGDGILRAARFVVFDDRSAYSLLSALHPEHHDNGTSPLLFWHLIQRLSSKTKMFDFEGSMDEGIEQSYRLYGAVQTPYFRVTKCNSLLLGWVMKHRI